MRPKFGNSGITMTEITITLVLQGFNQKNLFLEGCSWFKFDSLEVALGMALKFYTSVVQKSDIVSST